MFTSPSFLSFVVAVLAIWRVTHLLWGEDGPARVFLRLRRLAGAGMVGQAMDCFYCLSLWVAAPVAWLLTDAWRERSLLWLGLSGGAVVLERATTRLPAPPPASWRHEPETPGSTREGDDDVLLR